MHSEVFRLVDPDGDIVISQ